MDLLSLIIGVLIGWTLALNWIAWLDRKNTGG